MRKHRVPLGWPRRDPRHYRFPVPNEVWEFNLRPAEFVILSYLCYRQTHDRGGKAISAQAVADALHLTTATVEKHLVTLASKGPVNEGGALMLKCEAGKFFTLPNEVFLLALPPSVFLVYAYLLHIEDRKTYRCYASYKTIGRTVRMSVNTVAKYVRELEARKLVRTEPTVVRRDDGTPRNGTLLYTILPTRAAVEDCYQRQMRELEQGAAHRRAERRLNSVTRRHPTAAPCGPPG